MRIIPLIRLICLNPSTRRNNNKKYDVNLFVAITKTTLDISIIFIQKPNLRGRFYGTHYNDRFAQSLFIYVLGAAIQVSKLSYAWASCSRNIKFAFNARNIERIKKSLTFN